MENIITLEHVSKSYRNQQVLKDVSVSFEKGKIHGIIGRNGSGKTQMFKVIAGYVLPDCGNVIVNGEKIGVKTDYPRDLGMLIETPGFLPAYSGLFNLQMLAAMNTKLTREQLLQALHNVGLEGAVHKKVGQYSLGMRQRLGIAQAIMNEPQVIILDEPFNGLDNAGVKEIRNLLTRLRIEGKTILLSSHHAEDIKALCNTVHEMESGTIQTISVNE